MGAPQATENTQGSDAGSTEVSPGHVILRVKNRDLPKMVGTLIFIFKLRSHRERWHLVSLYAGKHILKFRETFSSSENSETGLE